MGWLSSYSIFISITYVLHIELINLGGGGTTIDVVVLRPEKIRK